MKNFLKTTKWWMYLPFACIYGQLMVRWVTLGKTYEDRFNRVLFLFVNMMYSTITVSILVALIIRNYYL